jgi:hypothetical protein
MCARAAVFSFIQEDVMETNVVKDLMAPRDGEPLAGALADAQGKAREFRKKATALLAEAEKWEAIAGQLEAVQDLARKPAATLKETLLPAKLRRVTRPYGFWNEQIRNAMAAWPAQSDRGPTKKELAQVLVAQVPDAPLASIVSTINNAIDSGKLVYRIQHLYLPGTEPGTRAAVA